MYLPFLFDDAAAVQREDCLRFLAGDPPEGPETVREAGNTPESR
jgi:hypothetical protein